MSDNAKDETSSQALSHNGEPTSNLETTVSSEERSEPHASVKGGSNGESTKAIEADAGAAEKGSKAVAGSSSRDREGQVELRFLIASKTAGAIIGKAGANIKRLREAYHARIIVPDSDGPDRVVTVECARETVRELLTELFQALLDDEKRNAAQTGSAAAGEVALTEADARLLIHQSQAGCLIGKEGVKIKQLRTELALRVFKIFPECCPRSTERVVQMLGEPRAIVDAVMTVETLLAANPPKGARLAYNPGMVEALQNAYGGWPVPYSTSFGGQLNVPPSLNHNPSTQARRGTYSGPNTVRRGMRGGLGPFRGGPGPSAGGTGPVYGGFDLFSNNSLYSQYTHTTHDGGLATTQVSLPDRLTGCIMGRGGQRIQQIRADSGAEIRVDNPQLGRDRVITIRGTPQQIQMAQVLLQQCVRKFSGIC